MNNNEKKVKYVKNSISYITNNLHFPERNFPKLQYTNVYMYQIKINNTLETENIQTPFFGTLGSYFVNLYDYNPSNQSQHLFRFQMDGSTRTKVITQKPLPLQVNNDKDNTPVT